MPGNALGLDIGGANLKAASADGRAQSRPFELWRFPDRLADELGTLVDSFPAYSAAAVTMTGELCDCFQTKQDGVSHILAAAESVLGEHVQVWSTDGTFLDVAEARRLPIRVAAGNWHALATLVGKISADGPALLVDVGSTTTDVIPILDRVPIPRGRTDPERMRSQELVYTGVRRTPVCALLGPAVASELFATMLDVNLILRRIAEDAGDCGTSDGRPATVRFAHARLARMLGGDAITCSESETRAVAQKAGEIQLRLIADAIRKVSERLPRPPAHAVIAGSGEFLARAAVELAFATSTRPQLISFRERFGPHISTAACAYAVAKLASEKRP